MEGASKLYVCLSGVTTNTVIMPGSARPDPVIPGIAGGGFDEFVFGVLGKPLMNSHLACSAQPVLRAKSWCVGSLSHGAFGGASRGT